jgi:hypothetical protein
VKSLKLQRERDIASLARDHRLEAFEVILRIMRDPGEATKFRLRCAEVVIERSDGKPRQQVEFSSQSGSLTSSDLFRLAEDLRSAEQDEFVNKMLSVNLPLLSTGDKHEP